LKTNQFDLTKIIKTIDKLSHTLRRAMERLEPEEVEEIFNTKVEDPNIIIKQMRDRIVYSLQNFALNEKANPDPSPIIRVIDKMSHSLRRASEKLDTEDLIEVFSEDVENPNEIIKKIRDRSVFLIQGLALSVSLMRYKEKFMEED